MGTPRQPGDRWYATRWSVLERDQFTCRYCGQFAPNVMLHVDHVVPVCEGGTDDLTNLVTACSACNIGKEMYRASVAREQNRARRLGSVQRVVHGYPPLDPAIREALSGQPDGLTVRQVAGAVGRERTGVLKTLNRMVSDGVVSVRAVLVKRARTYVYTLNVP